MSNPKIFVIAGPNGAGKSTGAATILPKRFPTELFLDADEIAKALATDSRIEAGRVMIRRMRELRERRETCAFESTLAGKAHVRFLSEAQDSGYIVHLAYVWLSSTDLAKKRVSVRVQRGGHDIPPADIERRYGRGLRNFFRLYMPLANRWALCDNSGRSLVLVARGRLGEAPTIHDQAIYPVEIKRSASPRREWTQPFSALDRLKPSRSEGGVVCLCRERLPLADKVTAIPVGLL